MSGAVTPTAVPASDHGAVEPLTGVAPAPQAFVDPQGQPYAWSFTCGACPGLGTVFVRTAATDEEKIQTAMRFHLLDVHGIVTTGTGGD